MVSEETAIAVLQEQFRQAQEKDLGREAREAALEEEVRVLREDKIKITGGTAVLWWLGTVSAGAVSAWWAVTNSPSVHKFFFGP